ncbi:MAG: hypothetical protein CMH63_00115 [Nanoarchaeota archaeon]|nr:hypothetical protein [Nanoarchaeota archaeon]|tara:strand:+ start:7 stop:276 length:270 start_codon:yes stop_codon:yes gene_type:complete
MANEKSILIPIIINTVGALTGIFLGIIIAPIYLFLIPLIAFFISWWKYKENFWKSFLISLIVITVLIILGIILFIYTDLGILYFNRKYG